MMKTKVDVKNSNNTMTSSSSSIPYHYYAVMVHKLYTERLIEYFQSRISLSLQKQSSLQKMYQFHYNNNWKVIRNNQVNNDNNNNNDQKQQQQEQDEKEYIDMNHNNNNNNRLLGIYIADIPETITSGVSCSRRGYVLLMIPSLGSSSYDQEGSIIISQQNELQYESYIIFNQLSPMVRQNISWIGYITKLHTNIRIRNSNHSLKKIQKEVVEEEAEVELLKEESETSIKNENTNMHKTSSESCIYEMFQSLMNHYHFQLDHQWNRQQNNEHQNNNNQNTNDDRSCNSNKLRVDCHPRQYTPLICNQLQKYALEYYHNNNNNDKMNNIAIITNHDQQPSSITTSTPYDGPIEMTLSRQHCTHRLVVVIVISNNNNNKNDTKTLNDDDKKVKEVNNNNNAHNNNNGNHDNNDDSNNTNILYNCYWGIEEHNNRDVDNIKQQQQQLDHHISKKETDEMKPSLLDVPLNHEAAKEIIIIPDEYLSRHNMLSKKQIQIQQDNDKQHNEQHQNEQQQQIVKNQGDDNNVNNNVKSSYSSLLLASSSNKPTRRTWNDAFAPTLSESSSSSLVVMETSNLPVSENNTNEKSMIESIVTNIPLEESSLQQQQQLQSNNLHDVDGNKSNNFNTNRIDYKHRRNMIMPLSRAYYKLEQLYDDIIQWEWKRIIQKLNQSKSNNNKVDDNDDYMEIIGLDVGASPGGWTQVLLHLFQPQIHYIVAIDSGELGKRLFADNRVKHIKSTIENPITKDQLNYNHHLDNTLSTLDPKHHNVNHHQDEEEKLRLLSSSRPSLSPPLLSPSLLLPKYTIMVCDASMFYVELLDKLLKHIMIHIQFTIPAIVIITLKFPSKTLGSIQKHINHLHCMIPNYIQSMIDAIYKKKHAQYYHHSNNGTIENNDNSKNDNMAKDCHHIPISTSVPESVSMASNQDDEDKQFDHHQNHNVKARYRILHLMANSDSERTLIVILIMMMMNKTTNT